MLSTRALVALIALTFLATDALASLSFSVHGDWGVPITWADILAKRSEDRNSKFILGIGDNFYGRLTHGYHGVKSTTDPKWKSIYEDIYTHKFFRKPWYIIAGNHDYEASIKAQIAYSDVSTRWKFPSRYHIVHAKAGQTKVDIFMIDTTPLSMSEEGLQKKYGIKFDSDQLRWLKLKLHQSNAKWKIVVGHHPIYKAQKGGDSRLQRYVNPILEKYKVAAYINGHTHNMQHVHSSKLHYITIGNGAIQTAVKKVTNTKKIKRDFIFPDEAQFKSPHCTSGGCRGFGVVTIENANNMKVIYYDSTGALLKTVKVKNPN